MKILIVEDEKLAFERLEKMLLKQSIKVDSITHISSIIEYNNTIHNSNFDLAFFDIELSDGLSFEILENYNINFPIIFTTAYNQYAIKAFKHNSIDYLLKPIDENELRLSLEKFDKHWNNIEPNIYKEISSRIKNKYKERFTIKIGEHIRIIETKNMALIYSQNKGTYIYTSRDFLTDFSLESISNLIDPSQFFRINRQNIISINYIKDIVAYSNSRLKIIMNTKDEQEIIVSREKVKDFKNWLNGE